MSTGPQINPGEIFNWPMLKIQYQTTHEAIAKLLPPGIETGEKPTVYLTVYNFPVNNYPEYGLLLSVAANCDGVEGEYTLSYSISKEAEVYISHEIYGQPKYHADIDYFRMFDSVTAKITHAGYTFLEFSGKTVGVIEDFGDMETNEFWVKYSRSADMALGKYDMDPQVIRIQSQYGSAHVEKVEGELTLRESPWDPIATELPMESEIEAMLWTPIFKDRKYMHYKMLDKQAFWPHTDVIGGSRWPGTNGGPKLKLGK
ncbi:MAG: acetoacetate decarboxylase family protein [Endozoicomonas sp.]